jgi:hypothetical protein
VIAKLIKWVTEWKLIKRLLGGKRGKDSGGGT